jgi:concanavalin A-like lectin/glucanase superfamily protein
VNAIDRWNSVIAKGLANSNSSHNYALEIDNSNHFICALGNGSSATTLVSSTAVSSGQFYHVACVWDGNTFRLYVNGAGNVSSAQSFIPVGNAAPAARVNDFETLQQ